MDKIYITEEAKREANRKYFREYHKTPMGRALNLLNAYNQKDKKYGRGKGDLTARWIVQNIFSKPCAHCGESDWRKIGCNRLNNSLPHTKDNVEPCCKNCNDRLHAEELSDTMKGVPLSAETKRKISEKLKGVPLSEEHKRKISENHTKPWLGKFGVEHHSSKAIIQLTKDNEFVKRWDSMMDVTRELGFNNRNISACCLGKRKSAYGFHWMFAEEYEKMLGEKIA